MSIQKYFDKKQQVNKVQQEFDETIEELVKDFYYNFYYKFNKTTIFVNGNLTSEIKISLFLPNRLRTEKSAIEILFSANLKLYDGQEFKLKKFQSFKVTCKEIILDKNNLLLMIYPELNTTDLTDIKNAYSVYSPSVCDSILKKRTQESHVEKFTDFCKNMIQDISSDIRTFSFNREKENININYTLNNNEHANVLKSFFFLFDNFIKTLDSEDEMTYLNIQGISNLLDVHKRTEQLRLHEGLTNALKEKTQNFKKVKI